MPWVQTRLTWTGILQEESASWTTCISNEEKISQFSIQCLELGIGKMVLMEHYELSPRSQQFQ